MRDTRSRRLLVEVERDRYLAVEAEDVFYLEAQGDDTLVRTRGKRPKTSVESLGALEKALPPGFFRIHRSFVVNLDRVRELRRQADGEGWEVKLEPPVNAVLPVARGRVKGLFAALGRPT
jgi:two-component system LytT family response regulator